MSCFDEINAYFVEVVQETPKAILCVNKEAAVDPEKFWVPKSVVDDCSTVHNKGEVGLLLTNSGIQLEVFSSRTIDHSDKGVCKRCRGTPAVGEEDLFLEEGLCSWCNQVEDHS